MRIAFHSLEKLFESELLNAFLSQGDHVEVLKSQEILENIATDVNSLNNFGQQKSSRSAFDCYILQAEDIFILNDVIDWISQFPTSDLLCPRIVVVSSLQTWNGRRYHVPISTSVNEFTSRIPTHQSINLYKLENKFHNCMLQKRIQIHIVSLGLLYGGKGFDLNEIFTNLWNTDKQKTTFIFSTCNGSNKIPAIHVDDFVKLLVYVTSTTDTIPFFIPAVDGPSIQLVQFLDGLSRFTGKTIRPMHHEDAMNMLLQETPIDNKLNLDITFDESHLHATSGAQRLYSNGLLNNTKSIWDQYVKESVTRASTIFVCGSPFSSKTSLAKILSEQFKIEYISNHTVVNYALQYKRNDVLSEDRVSNDTTLDLAQISDPALAIRIELERSIGVLLSSTKGKGKNDKEVDFTQLELKREILEGLPVELIRRCIASYLLNNENCLRNGYILDVWGSSIFTSLEDILEVNNPNAQVQPPLTERSAESNVEPAPQYTSDSNPQLIVEIQGREDRSLSRAMQALNIDSNGGKLSKDQQNQVKTVETLIKDYLAHCEDVEGTTSKSHKCVKGLEEKGFSVMRISIDDGDDNNVDLNDISKKIQSTYEEKFGKSPTFQPNNNEGEPIPTEDVATELVDETNAAVETDYEEAVIPEEEPKLNTNGNNSHQYAIEEINQEIAGLDENSKSKLKKDVDLFQAYLVENVLPHVAEALINIARHGNDGSIEDPVLYLADFLQERGQKIQDEEVQQKYERFQALAAQAKQLEEEAARALEAAKRKKDKSKDNYSAN